SASWNFCCETSASTSFQVRAGGGVGVGAAPCAGRCVGGTAAGFFCGGPGAAIAPRRVNPASRIPAPTRLAVDGTGFILTRKNPATAAGSLFLEGVGDFDEELPPGGNQKVRRVLEGPRVPVADEEHALPVQLVGEQRRAGETAFLLQHGLDPERRIAAHLL